MLRDNGHFIFQSMTKRNVTHIVHKCREAEDLHQLLAAALFLKKLPLLLHPLGYFCRHMHDTQNMLKPRMLRTGIYQVAQTKLTAAVEALELRRLQQSHFLRIKFDIAVDVVADYLHRLTPGRDRART